MGKQDDFQSHYFENKKRFADIYNGCLFGGKELMKPEDLEEADSVIVLPSLQTQATKIQDFLDSGQEPSSHERLSRTPKTLKLIPCITLVIYVGTDEPWDGKTELYELLDIDEDMKPYVSNYRFNLYDYHEHKDFSVFKTENRYLFETLAHSEDKESMMQYLENSPLQNTNDPDIVTAILGCIGEKMSKKDLKRIQDKETGGYDMCKALRDMIDEGILEGTIRTLYNLLNSNIISLAIAAQHAGVSEVRFLELVEQFQLNTNRN